MKTSSADLCDNMRMCGSVFCQTCSTASTSTSTTPPAASQCEQDTTDADQVAFTKLLKLQLALLSDCYSRFNTPMIYSTDGTKMVPGELAIERVDFLRYVIREVVPGEFLLLSGMQLQRLSDRQ